MSFAAAAGGAVGIVSAAIPLEAGFLVLDSIKGTVQCTNCGAKMHHSKQKMHRHSKGDRHTRHARAIDEGLGLTGGGYEVPDLNW